MISVGLTSADFSIHRFQTSPCPKPDQSIAPVGSGGILKPTLASWGFCMPQKAYTDLFQGDFCFLACSSSGLQNASGQDLSSALAGFKECPTLKTTDFNICVFLIHGSFWNGTHTHPGRYCTAYIIKKGTRSALGWWSKLGCTFERWVSKMPNFLLNAYSSPPEQKKV